MAKYQAICSIREGKFEESFTSTNKFKLWKKAKEWACAEWYRGYEVKCRVFDEKNQTVFEAWVTGNRRGEVRIFTTVYNYREKRY